MKRIFVLAILGMLSAGVSMAENLDSLRYYTSPSAYTYSIPVRRSVAYRTRKYPMGGQNGVPTIMQMQATSTDLFADSIAYASWTELSIDSLAWYVDNTSIDTISNEAVHFKVIAPNKGWNWFRHATQGLAANDSSGNVTEKIKVSYDLNRVKW